MDFPRSLPYLAVRLITLVRQRLWFQVLVAIALGIDGMVLIVMIAMWAAIDSPGTLGFGIVFLASRLTSIGIPHMSIGIILGVDRLRDMYRIVVNVTGDMVANVTTAKQFGHITRLPIRETWVTPRPRVASRRDNM